LSEITIVSNCFYLFFDNIKKKQGQYFFFRPFWLFDYNQLHEMQDSPNRSVLHVVVVIDHHYLMTQMTMNYQLVHPIIDLDIVLLVNQLEKKKKEEK
jgi:hypothetical protein